MEGDMRGTTGGLAAAIALCGLIGASPAWNLAWSRQFGFSRGDPRPLIARGAAAKKLISRPIVLTPASPGVMTGAAELVSMPGVDV
jgi:hypothetical protein